MAEELYEIRIQAEDDRAAQQATRSLADHLREVSGVLSVDRHKDDHGTMDLGVIVNVVITSGATLALARGIADWLRLTPKSNLTITHDLKTKSIKVEVNNINSADAVRILEIIKPR